MLTPHEKLITAAKEGDNEKVIELLNSEADPKAKDNDGDTALHWAADNGHAAVVTALVKAGADLEESSQDGDTALHCAAQSGHAAVVTALVQAGADLEAKDYDGNTALHWAANYGHEAVVTALVEKGANPDRPNQYGNTALHLAADNDHVAVVTALLHAGADLETKDLSGRTPLHRAEARDHEGIVFEIKEYDSRGEYKWRQHLPYLKKAAWKYRNSNNKTSYIKSIADSDTFIAAFLIEISIAEPPERLAFAKLLHMRLSITYPGKGFSDDVLGMIGLMLAAKPKTIPKIMEIFAKKMAETRTAASVAAAEPEAATTLFAAAEPEAATTLFAAAEPEAADGRPAKRPKK